MLCKDGKQSPSKKRSLQGTSLTSKNSFAVLDNEVIAELANSMGVKASSFQFETFDLMKDIEVARHAINKVKKIPMPDPIEFVNESETIANKIPLLQWLDDDSESEQFTLVQSRKKKKRQSVVPLPSLGQVESLRSKRNGPSVYRTRGGKGDLETSSRYHNSKKPAL
jgi:hypothetical protein